MSERSTSELRPAPYYIQGWISIWANLGCSPGAPRLEGPPPYKNMYYFYRHGVGGWGATIRNEGPPNFINPGASPALIII